MSRSASSYRNSWPTLISRSGNKRCQESLCALFWYQLLRIYSAEQGEANLKGLELLPWLLGPPHVCAKQPNPQ